MSGSERAPAIAGGPADRSLGERKIRHPDPARCPAPSDRQKLHGGIKAAQQHQTFSAGSGCPLVYCKVADLWPGSGAESTPIRTS